MSDVPHRSLPARSTGVAALRQGATERHMFQIAVGLTLLLPPVLLYTRAVADALLSTVAILFLINRWALRDLAWLRPLHVRLAMIFLAWVLFCTVITGQPHELIEALVLSRLFLFAAALEFWVLADGRQRRQLQYVIVAVAVWIAVESWQQFLLGTNLFGYPRWGNGVLTGPLPGPRAGLSLQTIYFAAFLPPAMALIARPQWRYRLAGGLVLILSMLTMALIGQRMPMLLVLLGYGIAALVMPGFRWPMVIAVIALGAAIAIASVAAPEEYNTLVTVFLHRMDDFWSEHYAILYQRAIVMVQAHPWVGLGFDGFRNNCFDPRYMRILDWLPVTDIYELYSCSIHPHNYWLQIATDSGLIGVALFAALCIAWLARIGRGMQAPGRPIKAGLFVSLCIAVWPIASSTGLFTVPNAGWLFLLIGWGLAEHQGILVPSGRPGR
ncbi:MAG TPA: O-antigen ligase family protein [Acetobacteraceae bacterium]|jgi:O-antigen ligase|nr:O-antigen ligase family protein [Acetobacteraceae bacterium]